MGVGAQTRRDIIHCFPRHINRKPGLEPMPIYDAGFAGIGFTCCTTTIAIVFQVSYTNFDEKVVL